MADSDAPRTIRFAHDPAYWQALGRFVEEFGSIEGVLLLLMAQYAKVDHSMAKAIFSGLRPDAVISQVKRIIEVYPPFDPKAAPEIEYIFAQLRVLNDARNLLAHHASFTIDGIGRVVSNASKAHMPRSRRQLIVSPAIIDNMTADLERIGTLVTYHAFRDTLTADGRAEFDKLLAGSWRYTPPPPAQPPKPKRTPPQPRGRRKPAQ